MDTTLLKIEHINGSREMVKKKPLGLFKDTAIFGLLTATALAVSTFTAGAQENCVNIAGTDEIKQTQTMDPAFLWGPDDAMHIWSVYEPLVELGEKFDTHPRLAESWESNADANVWTFHLRQGVKFHDGSDFTAKDARYSIMRLIDPKVASPAAPALSFLEGGEVVAVDDHTLQIRTKAPVVEMPIMLATKFVLMVKDGTPTETLAKTGNGTGAFMAPGFQRAGEVRMLVRNPNYWDKGLPKSDCLRITTKPDPLAMTASLLSGEIDYAPTINASSARSLKDAANVELLTSSQGTFLAMAMWTDTPPFDDVRIRKALKLVADRQAIVNAALLGFGFPANDHNVPTFFASSVSKTAAQQNIEEARKLLAEAGHVDDLQVDLFVAEIMPGLTQMATLYAQMASQAGITINLVTMPAASYWDDVWNKRPFYVTSWGLRSTADGLAVAHRSTAAWNETRWKRKDYDDLLDKAAATLDEEARFQFYRQAQQMLQDEGGTIIPVLASDIPVISKNCSGVKLYNTQQPDFRSLECKR